MGSARKKRGGVEQFLLIAQLRLLNNLAIQYGLREQVVHFEQLSVYNVEMVPLAWLLEGKQFAVVIAVGFVQVKSTDITIFYLSLV